ncbi:MULTISPECIES: hypothetical protein [Haloferax]|uniref:DUF7847 domain-containing protein n=2 Tax=Haloferax TaxID=2251 RepID=A0A6G1YY25_9EURY|nr:MULTISPECIES: hypothetical protein [Haloferax]KAB1186586.1 hypothetical protein Hfx1149_00450 [Haloferax sp. CBA1149]MRW79200.1 hypothetical protein [Haloferax marinisediminis]
MAALQALGTAGESLRRNPVLFAVTAAISLFQLPGLLAQAISPLLGSLISLVFSGVLLFVIPFFIGGVIGMANEATSGRTTVETFMSEGKAHYVSILAVYFGLLVLYFVLGFVSVFVVGFGGVILLANGSQPGLALLATIAVIGLAIFFVYFAVLFVSQFFGHAIVIDDLGAIDAIKRSVWCVRHNLVSVLGYTVVVTVGGAVLGVFGALFSLLTGPVFPAQSTGVADVGAAPVTAPELFGLPSVGLGATVGLVVLLVVVSSVLGAFFATYSTAFYRSIRPIQAN